jgi:predicted aspartyl protease
MRPSVARVLSASFVLLAFAVSAAAADRGERPHSVHMIMSANRSPVVTVDVNGRALRMILDTGSTHSSVTERTVALLDAPLVAKSAVRTSAGVTMLPIARLERLTLAGRSIGGLLATVVPANLLDPSGLADGIVGQDVLASTAYTLDFNRQCFTWESDPSGPAAAAWLELEAHAGRFVAEIPQARGTLRLVPDSGAEALVIYGSLAGRRELGEARLDTVAGDARAALAMLPRFEIAGHMLRNVLAAFLPERVDDGRRVDGLLPLSLFGRVTVDGPGRRLGLTP